MDYIISKDFYLEIKNNICVLNNHNILTINSYLPQYNKHLIYVTNVWYFNQFANSSTMFELYIDTWFQSGKLRHEYCITTSPPPTPREVVLKLIILNHRRPHNLPLRPKVINNAINVGIKMKIGVQSCCSWTSTMWQILVKIKFN